MTNEEILKDCLNMIYEAHIWNSRKFKDKYENYRCYISILRATKHDEELFGKKGYFIIYTLYDWGGPDVGTFIRKHNKIFLSLEDFGMTDYAKNDKDYMNDDYVKAQKEALKDIMKEMKNE